MHIDFAVQGGYGGLYSKQPLSCSIETDALPKQRRDELLARLDIAGLLQTPPKASKSVPKTQRDVFEYSLEIKKDNQIWHYHFDDATAPTEVKPLLQYLQQMALNHCR